jgi:hypothetical protein
MEFAEGLLTVADPEATVPPSGRAHAAPGARAPVTSPAAARPRDHNPDMGVVFLDRMRALEEATFFGFARRRLLAFRPLIASGSWAYLF